jgi:hypothetical protein
MKKLWLLLAIAVPLQSIPAQEVHHAPTVAQCQSDQLLWASKMEVMQPRFAGTADVSFTQLRDWGVEMLKCSDVDPGGRLRYFATSSMIQSRLITRYNDFLTRHHLYDQFLAEDAQGKGRQ